MLLKLSDLIITAGIEKSGLHVNFNVYVNMSYGEVKGENKLCESNGGDE